MAAVNVQECPQPVDNSYGEYDITPYQGCCCVCETVRHTLKLGLDETTREYVNESCGNKNNSVLSRPYAQLGSVDVSMELNCCCAEIWSVSTDGGIIMPAGKTGNFCVPTDKNLVEEIAAKLNERKVARGNIGLMKLHNANGEELSKVATMLDSIAASRNVAVPPLAITMDRCEFPNKKYDVQNQLEIPRCFCFQICPDSYQTQLLLEEDEVIKVVRKPCSQTSSRRPYAQLGVVSKEDNTQAGDCDLCAGCKEIGGHAVAIDAWQVMPGYGTERALVEEIANELQNRKVALGNIGQLKKAEQIAEVVQHIKQTANILGNELGTTVKSF